MILNVQIYVFLRKKSNSKKLCNVIQLKKPLNMLMSIMIIIFRDQLIKMIFKIYSDSWICILINSQTTTCV